MTSSITSVSQTGALYQSADRRKAERTPTDIQAILRFRDRLHAIQGSVCDLSVGGTGFICHQAVAAHSKCTVQFTLPAHQQSLSHVVNVPVIVISSMQVIGQAHQFRVNLQFVGIPPNVRSYIEAFIRHSLATAK